MFDDRDDLIDEAPSFTPKSAIEAVLELNWSNVRFLVVVGAGTVFWLVLAARSALPDARPASLHTIAKTLPDFGLYLGCALLVSLVGATVGAVYMALYWPARVQRNRQAGYLSKYEVSRIVTTAGVIVILSMVGLFLLAMWIYDRFFA